MRLRRYMAMPLAVLISSAADTVPYVSGYTELEPAHFRDIGVTMTLRNAGVNQYYTSDAFSRVLILLPAGASTSFVVEAVYNPSFGITSDPQTNIGVRTTTDPTGAGLTYNQTVTASSPPSDTRVQVSINVPAGTRAVELTSNAWLTGVSAASYYIVPAPAALRQLVIAGDSISTGNIASPVFRGFTHETRYLTRFDSVNIYGVSGDSIFNRVTAGGSSPPNGSLAAYAAQLVARAQRGSLERAIFIELGTNDYGLNYWTAANFGTQYAALLDAIHALDPTIRVYCMQMFHRSSEGANSFSSTLADYRAAVATAVSTRTSFCTLIDGFTAFNQAAVSSGGGDGLHPGTALHSTIAAWLALLL